jgi:hypothetical protein
MNLVKITRYTLELVLKREDTTGQPQILFKGV